jgi:hypothetical protein
MEPQHVAEPPEVGDLVGTDRQPLHALDEGVAGATRQQAGLAFEQGLPDAVFLRRVVVPALVDGPVGALRPGPGSKAMFGFVQHPGAPVLLSVSWLFAPATPYRGIRQNRCGGIRHAGNNRAK